MISKLFQSFFVGCILVLIITATIFTGIYSAYFPILEITEPFNRSFVENHNFYILFAIALPIGYLFLSSKIFQSLYLIVAIISAFTLSQDSGYLLGERLYLKNAKLKDRGERREIKLLYIGSEFAYIQDINDSITKKVKKELIAY